MSSHSFDSFLRSVTLQSTCASLFCRTVRGPWAGPPSPFPPHSLPSPPPSPLLLGRQMSAQRSSSSSWIATRRTGLHRLRDGLLRWCVAHLLPQGASELMKGIVMNPGDGPHPLSRNDTEEMCILLREDARKIRECSQVSFFSLNHESRTSIDVGSSCHCDTDVSIDFSSSCHSDAELKHFHMFE